MKAKLFILGLITIALAACSKDQYSTKPQLTFKSVNGTYYTTGQFLNFVINFTDKEGDIQDTLWVEKISYTCGPSATITAPYQVPNFTATKNLKGEFDISYIYGVAGANYPYISRCSQLNDSCYFRFWLKDKANHISDTVSSPPIVLLK